MAYRKETTVRIGPGFLALLALLFIGLKLTGHIAWSWLWVLAPLWIGPGIVIFLAAMFILAIAIINIFEWVTK